jgi:hypothetical protein
MRAMISRKSECLAGNDRRETVGVDAKSGKALRKRRSAAEPEKKRAASEGAAGYPEFIAHRRKS